MNLLTVKKKRCKKTPSTLGLFKQFFALWSTFKDLENLSLTFLCWYDHKVSLEQVQVEFLKNKFLFRQNFHI